MSDPQEVVAGLLHGPGFPVAGVPARLQFVGQHLRVSLDGGAFEDVPAESLEASVTGFNEDTLQIAWEHAGHTHAVTIADAQAQRALLANAPPGVAKKLGRGHATVNWHRRKWNTVLGVLAGLVVLVLVGWWQSEAITAWLANRVSLETEIDIGDRALAQLEREHVLTQEGLAARTIADIGARLTQGSRYKYRWYVSDDREVNAYALPGGIVVINAGMIEEAGSAEELAGVLAHEVQHVELRHSIRGMIKSLGLRGLFAFATGDIGGSLAGEAVVGMTDLKFSRDDESEADQRGLDALIVAGIDPSGMPAFFEKMSKQSGEAPLAFVSSHPASADREAALRARVSATTKTYAPLSTGPWPPR